MKNKKIIFFIVFTIALIGIDIKLNSIVNLDSPSLDLDWSIPNAMASAAD